MKTPEWTELPGMFSLQYEHQVRPEDDPFPFELRTVQVKIRVWAPCELEPWTAYQVMDLEGGAHSDTEPTLQLAMSGAEMTLIAVGRIQYQREENARRFNQLAAKGEV